MTFENDRHAHTQTSLTSKTDEMGSLQAHRNSLIDRINVNTLVTIYLLEHRGTTQADLAKRLGVTPAKFSRVINTGKYLDQEWKTFFAELIQEIDFEQFDAQYRSIKTAQQQLLYLQKQAHLRPLIYKYFEEHYPEAIPDAEVPSSLYIIASFSSLDKTNLWRVVDGTEPDILEGMRLIRYKNKQKSSDIHFLILCESKTRFEKLLYYIKSSNRITPFYTKLSLLYVSNNSIEEYTLDDIEMLPDSFKPYLY